MSTPSEDAAAGGRLSSQIAVQEYGAGVWRGSTRPGDTIGGRRQSTPPKYTAQARRRKTLPEDAARGRCRLVVQVSLRLDLRLSLILVC